MAKIHEERSATEPGGLQNHPEKTGLIAAFAATSTSISLLDQQSSLIPTPRDAMDRTTAARTHFLCHPIFLRFSFGSTCRA